MNITEPATIEFEDTSFEDVEFTSMTILGVQVEIPWQLDEKLHNKYGYCDEMEERKMDANDMLYEMRKEKYRLGGDTDVY